MTLRTDADVRAWLAAGERAIAPGLERAILRFIAALRAEGLDDDEIAAAVARRLDVAQVVYRDGRLHLVMPDVPDAALAFSTAPGVVAITATTETGRALVRTIADAVREAERRANDALPPVPPRPRPPQTGAPGPDPGRFPRSLRVAFQPGIPGAADAAVRYAGTAYEYLAAELQAGVREAVEEGLRQGRNPRDIARGIRDVVGLGPGQARWVANLRDELETGRYGAALDRRMLRGPVRQTVAAAARHGRALTPAQVDRIVGAYRTNAIAERAETIARTMSLDLLREGQLAALRAAVQRGDYAGLVVLKQWVTTLDGREREAHRALHGRRVPLHGTWNDAGVLRQVPGGWNCRCSWRAVPVPEADAARALGESPPPTPIPTARPTGDDTPPAERVRVASGGSGGAGGGGGRGGRTSRGDEFPEIPPDAPEVRVPLRELLALPVPVAKKQALTRAKKLVGRTARTPTPESLDVEITGGTLSHVVYAKAGGIPVQQAAIAPQLVEFVERAQILGDPEKPRDYADRSLKRVFKAGAWAAFDDGSRHAVQLTYHDYGKNGVKLHDARVRRNE